MNGLRRALGVAVIMALGLAGYAHAHDGPHAPEALSGHTAAGLLSATNVDGPKTAKYLRIGIWNSASITVYHIGQSWNDWVLYLLYDKLLEPSPYLSKGALVARHRGGAGHAGQSRLGGRDPSGREVA